MRFLHEFPAKIETPLRTYVDYRLMTDEGPEGLRARIYAKGSQVPAAEQLITAVEPLGNATWMLIGTTGDAWRVQRTRGCGCGGGKVLSTAPEIMELLTHWETAA